MTVLYKKTFFIFIIIFLVVPVINVTAQTNTGAGENTFDMSRFPQWSRDLRRWEIIAFGSFPFTVFMATFGMETYNWGMANGFDLTDEGRRYAPWPLKSAGAMPLTSREHEIVFIAAASASAAIAIADMIIINVKKQKERRRYESMPAGTTIITRRPYIDESADEDDYVYGEESTDPKPEQSNTINFSIP